MATKQTSRKPTRTSARTRDLMNTPKGGKVEETIAKRLAQSEGPIIDDSETCNTDSSLWHTSIPFTLDYGAHVPTFATVGSAGADMYAKTGVRIARGGWASVDTGVHVAIPQGYVGLVFPRSGLARKYGLSFVNGVGVIDSDYRGAIGMTIINNGTAPYQINRGDRIGQIVIVPFMIAQFIPVSTLDDTERGTGGFGSTGR